MADAISFYTNPMSRGRIIRWMLEEVGQPYDTVIFDYTKIKDPSYLAINPMGKVPAIKHGDMVVTECAAICAYLADAFPQAGLAPPVTNRLRGTYYRWLFFAAGPLEAMTSNHAMGWIPPADKQRMFGYGSREAVLDVLEKAVSQGEYLVGDSFTAADLYLGAHIGWGMQFGTLEKRPAYETYFARLSDRPAAKRALEIDNNLMAQMQKAG